MPVENSADVTARLEVFTALNMSMFGFWIVTPCVLKMEAICPFEILVSTYKSIRNFNPKDQHGLWMVSFVIKIHSYYACINRF